MKLRTLKLGFVALFAIAILHSCGPEMPAEYKNKYAYRIDWNGDFYRTSQTQIAAFPEFWIYCRNGVQDCYDLVQENQGYGIVHTYLQRFYDAYAVDTLDSYFDIHKEEFKDIFPDIETDKPGAIDSLAAGNYYAQVSGLDSSIVVFRSKTAGPVLSNLVFVVKRSDIHH